MWELHLSVRIVSRCTVSVHGCTRSPPLLLFHHLVFIIVEITVKMTRAIYIAKRRVLPESCVKVSVGAFPEETRTYDLIWH